MTSLTNEFSELNDFTNDFSETNDFSDVSSSHTRLIIWGVILALVTAVGVGAYFFFVKKRKNKKPSKPSKPSKKPLVKIGKPSKKPLVKKK
jgi:flagellar basal body-associated protein FliL